MHPCGDATRMCLLSTIETIFCRYVLLSEYSNQRQWHILEAIFCLFLYIVVSCQTHLDI